MKTTFWATSIILLVSLTLVGCGISQTDYDAVVAERDGAIAAKESAETLGERFKDDEVQAKFKEVGRAAQAFGKNVSDLFSESKGKTDNGEKPAE